MKLEIQFDSAAVKNLTWIEISLHCVCVPKYGYLPPTPFLLDCINIVTKKSSNNIQCNQSLWL